MAKWSIDLRPNDIDEIFGGDVIKTYLKNRLKENNFNNAYLFKGMTGGGKTTWGKIFAKYLMCKNLAKTGHICKKEKECENCKAINNNSYNSPDMLYINCAEDVSKSEVASRVLAFSDIGGTWGSPGRVVFLDEIQELSSSGQKTLLNLLEFPRKKLYFILTSMENTDGSVKTGEGKKVPISVLRRCHIFNINKVSDLDIMYYLRDVLKKTNTTITPGDCSLPEFLDTIGQNCYGSIGMALSMLEVIIDSEINTKKQILEFFAIPDVQVVQKALMDILNGKNSESVFSLMEADHGDKLDNTFGLIYKLIGDGEMYKAFGKINDKRDLFIKQAAELGGHKNFPILKNTFQVLSQSSSPFLKKTDFILAVTNAIFKCKSVINSTESVPVRKATRQSI
jgi:DNA polymerase III gamma/tau subunit